MANEPLHNVVAWIDESGRSLNDLSDSSNIALTTLRRKRKQPENFTLGELLALSEQFGTTPDALLATTPPIVTVSV